MLSGYRFLWIQVLFDLPVTTKEMRKNAIQFRNLLLDLGFYMCQLSVYFKWCTGKESGDGILNKIKTNLPTEGKIHIIFITDKQYGNILTFSGKKTNKKLKNPIQYDLF